MRTIAEIDSDIAKVQAELKDVHGTTTEVYARIVGYYRSVRNWNRGKREEYNHRMLFKADEGRIHEHLPFEAGCGCGNSAAVPGATMITETAAQTMAGPIAEYELFVRKTCPNCPPVKECCTNLPLSGKITDVDTEEGLVRAEECGIVSAPTVIFYDAQGTEVARAHSVKQIRAIPALSMAAEAAPALF